MIQASAIANHNLTNEDVVCLSLSDKKMSVTTAQHVGDEQERLFLNKTPIKESKRL